ncbi:MAG: HD domain-containing phosphohydrolase [Cyanobacteriota bacterium]
MTYNILVVDDEINNLKLLKRTFRKDYNVFMASGGHEGLEIMRVNKIDLVITDQRMPGMCGVDFLEKTVEEFPDTIRLIITGYTDADALIKAINTGRVYRYIKKPWEPEELKNTVKRALESYQLNIDNQKLTMDLKELFSGTISAITEALDAKDEFTSGRSKRVTKYAIEIGRKLGLDDTELQELELAGLLHDIGMIGIPESILNKEGELTTEEYSIIKQHSPKGVKILENIRQLENVVVMIKFHHERYDGKGYPEGLAGEEIPLGARIISVADAYDGMVSDRPYRKGLDHNVAIEIIRKDSGTHFDPVAVEAFLEIVEETKDVTDEIDTSKLETFD